jgi:hypothetical protein
MTDQETPEVEEVVPVAPSSADDIPAALQASAKAIGEVVGKKVEVSLHDTGEVSVFVGKNAPVLIQLVGPATNPAVGHRMAMDYFKLAYRENLD